MRQLILASLGRRRLALAGILLAGGLLGAAAFRLAALPVDAPDPIGGPFTLVDGDGRTVTDRDFAGRFMLLYFGYTTCPDVCPTTLANVAEALERLGNKAERVQPIFISIDPARDTPEAVKAYVKQFSPRLLGLTGSPGAVAAAARAYRVYYAPHRNGPGPDDYTMDHSSILYLVGPDGRFVGPIGAEQKVERLSAELDQEVS